MSASKRPRPRTHVLIDPSNAYTRLGASPLDSTEEIKALILKKRNDANARRRLRADQQFGKEDAEITELQRIEEEIGSPRARTAYDLEHPHNELLTVQPNPRDRWLDRRHRAGLLSAWLLSELGRDAFLPTPECQQLWAPGGLDPDLAQALAAFVTEEGSAAAPAQPAPELEQDAPLEISSLKRAGVGARNGAPPDPERCAPQSAAPEEE